MYDGSVRPAAHDDVLANVQVGDLIDPMCGGGTIPVESMVMYGALKSDIFTIGGDFDENCVSLTAKH